MIAHCYAFLASKKTPEVYISSLIVQILLTHLTKALTKRREKYVIGHTYTNFKHPF